MPSPSESSDHRHFSSNNELDALPIYACLDELAQALLQRDEVVLQAPPGAGKTTQIPLTLLKQPWLGQQKIIVLEPRRVAALNAATRMAEMLGEVVGQTVGYRMRGASKVGPNTQIEVITEGLLTRKLQEDPELTGVGIVVFDEFHERSINTDTGLALCLQAREVFREHPLKLLIMSATLDGESVAELLGNAPMITSEGRAFPVECRYLNQPLKNNALLVEQVAKTVLQALEQEPGDALVFLPGVSEINRAYAAINAFLPENIQCYTLHGGLSLADQKASLEPSVSGQRKVVLATDIAETSLTIQGVRIVVDAGLVRAPEFDPNTGLTRLDTQGISLASAEQRAGRAGRLESGCCYRLWTEVQHKQKVAHAAPEIVCSDLMPLAMTLLAWGARHFDELSWLTPPKVANWQQALDALRAIDAIDESDELTTEGVKLSTFPCHPRVAKLLRVAQENAFTHIGCLVAAVLSEKAPRGLSVDLTQIVARLLARDASLSKSWRNRIASLSRQFETLLSATHSDEYSDKDRGRIRAGAQQKTRAQNDKRGIEDIGWAMAKAFPERIAKRHAAQEGIAVFKLANGRAAHLDMSEPLAHYQWIVVADAGGHKGTKQDRIFLGAPLNEEVFSSVLADRVTPHVVAQWDEKKQRFIAETQHRIGKLIIASEPIRDLPPNVKATALTELVRQKGLSILHWSESAQQLCAKVHYLRERYGEPWPDLSDEGLLHRLEQWLTPALEDQTTPSINTLNDFKKIAIDPLIAQQLPWPLPQQLKILLPERVLVPSGREVVVDYMQNPPVLAVKLQEMFGCQTTPTVMNDELKLMLHLLSPAKRPLQVTQDLGAFWQNGYDSVKKEMRGRYPKHPWPDDPLAAAATAYTKKRAQNTTQ